VTLELQGRVALVTGASRGIGYAIAAALRSHGARVAALARDKDALDAAVSRLTGADGESVLQVPADVTDTASVREAVAAARAWGGRLDIVVNCAGPQLAPSPLADTPDTVLTGYLDVKLVGFHRVASAALPLISDTGTGRIINIAGQTARTLVPNAGVTGITNAAVIALTSYLASEGAHRHVLVNAISPGMTLTEGWISRHDAMAAQQGTTGEAVRDGMTKGVGIRLGRWAEASEIAQAAVFLASDRSSYITGQVIEVDGGLTKSVT
jgi:NAD(P)-dependent dehydrogenase (short-subunit alcohol dehydrogenase family)